MGVYTSSKEKRQCKRFTECREEKKGGSEGRFIDDFILWEQSLRKKGDLHHYTGGGRVEKISLRPEGSGKNLREKENTAG